MIRELFRRLASQQRKRFLALQVLVILMAIMGLFTAGAGMLVALGVASVISIMKKSKISDQGNCAELIERNERFSKMVKFA